MSRMTVKDHPKDSKNRAFHGLYEDCAVQLPAAVGGPDEPDAGIRGQRLGGVRYSEAFDFWRARGVCQ